MAHIGIIMTGLVGNLNSSLELVARLKSEGHQITYLAVRDVKEKVENHGIKYIQLPERNFTFKHDGYKLKNSSWFEKFKYHIRNKGRITLEGKYILRLDEYEKIVSSLKLEKALIHHELHELIFVCSKLKIPTTLFSTWFNHLGKGPKFPPIRTDIIPGKGFRGTMLNIKVTWLLIHIKARLRSLLNALNFAAYRRQTLLRYGRDNGFPINRIRSTNLPPLFSYPKMRYLLATMMEIDFPHKRNNLFHHIGPLVFTSRDDYAEIGSINSLKSVFSKKIQENKKIIFCSVSTYVQGDVSFLKKVIHAVKGVDEWLLVITMGGKLKPDTFNNIPDNVYLFDWVPQLKVLENADCSINHAGINSINECIHFAVPMLVYSGKKFDQNGCAARVHYQGLGIMGDKDKESSKDIKVKIEKILHDPSYKQEMEDVNNQYQEYRSIKLSSLLA